MVIEMWTKGIEMFFLTQSIERESLLLFDYCGQTSDSTEIVKYTWEMHFVLTL